MKFFSITEANRALVLVKPIVLDVMNKWSEVKKIKEECDKIILNHLEGEAVLEEKEDRLDDLLAEIEGHILELQEIGVEFKGFDEGLIDFPAKISTRMVYLCWKATEDKICCWHEIFEGFSGRKEIDAALRTEIEQEYQATRQKNTA